MSPNTERLKQALARLEAVRADRSVEAIDAELAHRKSRLDQTVTRRNTEYLKNRLDELLDERNAATAKENR